MLHEAALRFLDFLHLRYRGYGRTALLNLDSKSCWAREGALHWLLKPCVSSDWLLPGAHEQLLPL
jgi:hypothetical protein